MKIISKIPNPSGAFPPIQESNFFTTPKGYAIWPDGLSADTFYEYNGFIIPTFEAIDDREYVKSYIPNTDSRNAWMASLPEEPMEPADPEESVDPGESVTDAEMAAAILEGVNEV